MKSPVEVWLWILLVMHPYNDRTPKLIAYYESAKAAAEAMRDGECPFLNEQEQARVKTTHTRDVNIILQQCQDNDIRIITMDDEEYPARLRAIYNAPILLFVQGTLAGLDDELSLAVVGTRNASQYGLNATSRICRDLCGLGTIIVSGLAVGIDAAAHNAALEAGGRTIGVLACGHMVDYPAPHTEMKKKIIENGGALVSELLPTAGVSSKYFQQRNRLISGLAMGTIIAEAPLHSGSLITAEYASQQGRELFCIPPHDIFSADYAGVIPYLRDGAIPLFSYLDIVNEYMFNYTCKMRFGTLWKLDSALEKQILLNTSDGQEKAVKKPARKSAKQATEQAEPESSPKPAEDIFTSLEQDEAVMLRLIIEKPRSLDELIELTGIQHINACTALASLEIMGIIQMSAGGIYSYNI